MQVIIPVGYAFFQRKHYNNSKLQKQLTMKRKTILYDKYIWKISEEDFQKSWGIIFQFMEESQVITLQIDSNRYPQVIRSLQNVKFSRLKHLNLQHNRIINIEPLYTSDMPELEELYLGQNYICHLKNFRKNRMTKLEYLNLHNNPIIDIDCICEFPNKQLSKIHLQWQDCNVLGQGIVWAAKLNVKTLKFISRSPDMIGIQSSKRIFPAYHINMLKNLYKSTQIWTSCRVSV